MHRQNYKRHLENCVFKNELEMTKEDFMFLKKKSSREKENRQIEMYFEELPKSLYAILVCTIIGAIIGKFMEPSDITRKEIGMVCLEKNFEKIKIS